MNNRRADKRKPRQGISITEFALLAVFLTMTTLLTMDLGRIFFAGITLANAASTGAFYAILDEANATDYTGMEAAALSELFPRGRPERGNRRVCALLPMPGWYP